ncbi:hypothetical protein Mal15_04870 [Stieleria maiorica]|uniref:Uncharacterized protein n=1 Tax=Stieleria maiorica TaxID=2795974 RepID=A0A5B9M6W6_9BACT|nr:hypothetical protein [Stieleria maiorica]QEF96459.1 hypothetical protein Mal15_04870 [Stieleria maiorica]
MNTPEESTDKTVNQSSETEPHHAMDGISETVDGTIDARAANASAQQNFGSPPPGAEYGYGI